ncbi:hypothetical protein [Sanguibacter sp. Z1732]|uniref:hypothetical protein n=1 Tax=Sanguibacter sp. Z1732 TaxID=3435412 RepID=UPI003D9CB00C
MLALGIGSTVRIERRRRRATNGAREFATRHAWRYEEESEGLTESFELPITASGRLRRLRSRNLLSGTYRSRAAQSWEFAATERTKGSSRSRGSTHVHLYHLAALKADRELPALTITSRGGAFSRALAGAPSQTTGDAGFDRAWGAKAQNQGVLRALLGDGFRARLLDFHGELDGLATRGSTLLLWRKGRQQAEDIEPLLEKAAEILRHLERRG